MREKLLGSISMKKKIIYCLFIFSSTVGLLLLKYGKDNQMYNVMLFGLMFIFCCNVAFAISEFRNRIAIFLFHMMLFLFLISRFFIPFLEGKPWWTRYSVEANIFAVYAISISMISIVAGCIIYEVFFLVRLKKSKKKKKYKYVSRNNLLRASRIALIICMVCFFMKELDKLMIMSNHSYEEYYSIYKCRLPFILKFVANCMPYVLCIYLSFKPPKKETFFVLCVYIVSAIPMLKIGVRNPFVLNCLFSFVYYVLRDRLGENNEVWIGKIEKTIIIIAIPTFILFFGAYNYLRADEGVKMNAPELVIDFMYKQGTTYDTVLQGYMNQEKLPYQQNQTYSFGVFSNYFYHNTIGRKLFNTPDLGTGNCFKAVYNGHSFSHAISYVVLGSRYIAGEGRGSSYIIENYIDWGYAGVVIFSIVIGMICMFVSYGFGKNWLTSTIILNIVTSIFFIPRAETCSFLLFLISYQFWLTIVGVISFAILLDFVFKKLKKIN